MLNRWSISEFPGHLLLVEDDDLDARAVVRALERTSPGEFQVTAAKTWREGKGQLTSRQFDAVLLDLHLPDRDGIALVCEATESAPSVPLIVITGTESSELAYEALRKGAQDYVVKGEVPDRNLVRIVRHAVERRRAMDALLEMHLQSSRLQDEFLSHVSHELRTPLTAIYQFVTILLDGIAGDLGQDQKEYLEIALRNVNQMRQMIDDLLDVTRAQTGKLRIDPRRIDLAEIVSEVVDSFLAAACQKEIDLALDLRVHDAWVLADGVRIRQVLSNLIANAIKFTRSGGAITVSVDQAPDGFRVAVTDTGVGIDSESLQKVFSRLYQGENKVEEARQGLGLGLFICKEIIDQHDGKIEADSAVGRGSTFCFTLPEFSLERLIAPVLESNPDGPFTLICARLSIDPGESGRPTEVDLDTLHQMLVENVLRASDLVLPRRGWDGGGESHFILVNADSQGASAVIRRIERQFSRAPVSKYRGILFTIQVIPIEPDGSGDVGSHLAKTLSRIMKTAGGSESTTGRNTNVEDPDHR